MRLLVQWSRRAIEAKWVEELEVEVAEQLSDMGEEVAESDCVAVAGVIDADFATALVFQDYFHLIECLY